MKSWRIFRKRSKLALLALALSGSVLGGQTVDAAVLVATIPSDYTNSELGTVTGSRVTTHVDSKANRGVVKNLNRDPGLYGGVTINGKSMLLLRQYTYSTVDLKPVQILDMDGDPNKPVASGIIASAANPHAAASNGNYVFMADYDLGIIGVAKIEGNKLIAKPEMDITVERFKTDLQNGWNSGIAPYAYGDDVDFHGEGLYVDHDHLFVAYNVNPKSTGWMEYRDGVLAEYEILDSGKLRFQGAARIGKNVDTLRINKYNDHYITNAIGGMQHYGGERNPESGVFIVSGHPSEGLTKPAENSRVAAIPQNVVAELNNHFSDFYNTKVTPDGQAYILAYGLNAGKVNQFQVYKTTMSNLYSNKPVDWEKIIDTSPDNGWFGRIDYDYYTKRLWAEIGSQLRVYTDGDKNPTHTWAAKDFSTNDQHYTFNAVQLVEGDKVTGGLATLKNTAPAGVTVYNNPDLKATSSGKTYKAAITGTSKDVAYKNATTDNKNYKFTQDVNISRNLGVGDPHTNVYAGIFAREGNDVAVDATGHIMAMNLVNDVGSPIGIFAGNGKNITVKSDGLNIVTNVNAEHGNSISHGIWNDAGKNIGSTINLTGPVQINMKGGFGGYGVAVQKLNRWGENSHEASVKSKINIHGDLSVRSENGKKWGIEVNEDNVFSRFNSAGLLTNVNNSEITVDGNVDLRVYGNGITVNAQGSEITVGGGRIEVPTGRNYGYYAIGAYLGTVNMNTGKNGNVPGNNTVQLAGDIFTLETGTVNLALTNGNSYLEGIVDNGGTANLALTNGAAWYNIRQNKRYKADNEDVGAGEKSRITKLTGGSDKAHAGVIVQRDKNPIKVDNYSGHTTVIYEHDTTAPADPNKGLAVKGGDLRITKATEGSGITLRTDNAGLNTASTKAADKNLVSGTLNKLANKLYYEAHTKGEKNLIGKVEIAEGLTAQSASRRIENITYKDADGQGQYLYTPAVDSIPDPNPDEQVTNPMLEGIDGTAPSEKAYTMAGIYKAQEDIYRFTKDPAEVKADTTVSAGIKDIVINAKGKLLLTAKDAGITANGHNVTVTAQELEANASAGTAISANTGTITVNGRTKLSGKTGIQASDNGVVTLNGSSTITATDAVDSRNGGKVTLNGGTVSGNLSASQAGTITLTGGKADSDLVASDGAGSTIALRGGTYNIKKLQADHGGTLTRTRAAGKQTALQGIEAGKASSVGVP